MKPEHDVTYCIRGATSAISNYNTYEIHREKQRDKVTGAFHSFEITKPEQNKVENTQN